MVMSSTASKFTAVRVKKMDLASYATELAGPGLYFLLISNDSVYVGQSGLSTVGKRILSTHSGTIDSSWHTVVGFVCTDQNIGANELLYMENALCEYVHANFPKCLTTTPSKANCNSQYRIQHYHLNSSQIHACNHYINDIKFYMSLFQPSVFPTGVQIAAPLVGTKETFYFKSPARDSDGIAEILIHCGHENARQTILKAGSKVSSEVSDKFAGYQKVIADRTALESQGKLVARVLQVDVPFSSQSGAGQFLNGTSFNGNSNWKTAAGVPLKNLL